MALEGGSSLLQMNSNSSLHENVRTVPAKIKDFNGPGAGKFILQMNSNRFLHKHVRTVPAKIKDSNVSGVGKLTFANEFK